MGILIQVLYSPKKAFAQLEGARWLDWIVGGVLIGGWVTLLGLLTGLLTYRHTELAQAARDITKKAIVESAKEVANPEYYPGEALPTREILSQVSENLDVALGDEVLDETLDIEADATISWLLGRARSILVFFLFALGIQTLIFHPVLVKDKERWPASLGVVVLSKVPILIGAFLVALVAPVLKNPYFTFSLGSFFTGPLGKALGNVDAFSIWSLVIMGLGFGHLSGKRTLAFAVVFGAWALWTLLTFPLALWIQ